MRKKIFTALAAGTLAATCAIGFTACGNGGIPKGVEVSEDEWKTAIEATLKADSYTFEITGESSQSETENGTVTVSETTTTKGTGYVASDSYYVKYNENVKTTGTSERELDVAREQYYKVDGQVLWSCTYTDIDYKKGGTDVDGKWEASSQNCNSAEVAEQYLAGIAGVGSALTGNYVATKNGDDWKTLADLYSEFTYSGGKYTATLYNSHYEVSVEISIKGGYVIGLSTVYAEEYTEDGVTTEYETKSVYSLKNYGKTTVTAPDGATEAISAKS